MERIRFGPARRAASPPVRPGAGKFAAVGLSEYVAAEQDAMVGVPYRVQCPCVALCQDDGPVGAARQLSPAGESIDSTRDVEYLTGLGLRVLLVGLNPRRT